MHIITSAYVRSSNLKMPLHGSIKRRASKHCEHAQWNMLFYMIAFIVYGICKM